MTTTLDRERQALEEMARTDVRASTAWLVVAFFLATLPLLALVQRFVPKHREWAEHHVVVHWPTAAVLAKARREEGWLGVNTQLRRGIGEVDAWFERGSELGRWIRPPVQSFLLERCGYGNGLVRAGRDGWLFWEKEISAVAAPPLLAPSTLARQHLRPPESDPATAIVDFGAQLRARGIELVVVPIPGKAGIETAHFAGSEAAASTPIQNRSLSELERRLGPAGLELFDPAPLLALRARTIGPQYLRTDSHWRPEAMAAVAHELATLLRRRDGLTPTLEARLADSPQTRAGGHDLVGLLGFPTRGSGPMYESVTYHQVVVADEERHGREETAGGILLLGDSYSEIYASNFESWGAGAGFADRLTFELGRPVARLTVEAGLGFDAREALAAKLAGEPHFLDSIRIVIYEFAARELVLARWRLAALPTPGSPGAVAAKPSASSAVPPEAAEPSARKHRKKRHAPVP